MSLSTSSLAFDELPGGDLVRKGLADLEQNKRTVESLLVLLARTRLASLGLTVPDAGIADPDHELYFLLRESHGDGAHSQYNALIRRLVSFERAAQCAK